MSLLKLDPEETLDFFRRPDNSAPSKILRLTNEQKTHVAWKVKVTAQEEFVVRPSFGTLEPGGSQEVVIIWKAFQGDVSKVSINTKFLVQAFAVSINEQVPRERWSIVPKGKIQQHRLGVALQQKQEQEQGKEEAPTRFLKLDPEETLDFVRRPDNSAPSKILRLTNEQKTHVAWKVKITAPTEFVVRPSFGTLEPGGSQEIVIIWKAFQDDVSKVSINARFLVQAFVTFPTERVQEFRLGVALQQEQEQVEAVEEEEQVHEQEQREEVAAPEPLVPKPFADTQYRKHYDRDKALPDKFRMNKGVCEFLRSFYTSFKMQSDDEASELAEEFTSLLSSAEGQGLDELDPSTIKDLIAKPHFALGRYWSAAVKDPICQREFCGLMNEAIRSDDENIIKLVAKLAATLNMYCVRDRLAGAQQEPPWPKHENAATGQFRWQLWRGGRLPDEKLAWYDDHKGKDYRVNMFLSTSTSKKVAERFMRDFSFPVDASHALYHFYLHETLRCQHLNCMEKVTHIKDEQEFLFPPYSAFRVRDILEHAGFTEIVIDVHPDNLHVPENVPTAPWA